MKRDIGLLINGNRKKPVMQYSHCTSDPFSYLTIVLCSLPRSYISVTLQPMEHSPLFKILPSHPPISPATILNSNSYMAKPLLLLACLLVKIIFFLPRWSQSISPRAWIILPVNEDIALHILQAILHTVAHLPHGRYMVLIVLST